MARPKRFELLTPRFVVCRGSAAFSRTETVLFSTQRPVVRGTARSRRVQAEIEGWRAMGEPADGDEVDARLRNPPCGLGRNAARGLADRAVADHSDAALEIVQRHIVEEHGVDADAERLFELSERVDLDLDLDKVADIGAGAADSLRDRTRDRDVVVLDQNRIVEAEAVIGAAASAHRIFLDRAQERRRLARA